MELPKVVVMGVVWKWVGVDRGEIPQQHHHTALLRPGEAMMEEGVLKWAGLEQGEPPQLRHRTTLRQTVVLCMRK